MKNQPKKQQLKQRRAWIRKALMEAGTNGMGLADLLGLARVNEPHLNKATLAVYIADHQSLLQAERGNRTRAGFRYYHRGTLRSMGAKAYFDAFRTVPKPDPRTPHQRTLRQQRRAITIRLPRLPRVTRLRAYSVAITVYAVLITASAL